MTNLPLTPATLPDGHRDRLTLLSCADRFAFYPDLSAVPEPLLRDNVFLRNWTFHLTLRPAAADTPRSWVFTWRTQLWHVPRGEWVCEPAAAYRDPPFLTATHLTLTRATDLIPGIQTHHTRLLTTHLRNNPSTPPRDRTPATAHTTPRGVPA